MDQSPALSSLPEAQPKQRLIRRTLALFHGALKELASPKERRNPYLDGLRTIAVLLVINGHCSDTIAAAFGSNAYTRFPLEPNGWIGVDLFFVLSGFFIGSQLWRELDKTGTISFKNFVIRRGLRIWPLYFFIFICVSLLLPGLAAAKQHGWSDLVFLTNYLPHGIVLGGWSLCTEEQFYLLAPAALLLIGARSKRSYRWGLGLLFVLEFVVRAVTYHAHTGHLFVRSPAAFEILYYPFHTHCDGLIAGLFISNLASVKSERPAMRRPWLLVLAGFVVMLAAKWFQPETLDFTGLALFFGALVWWGTQKNIRIFDSRIFYWFSRLSFGMYLIHPYFIHLFVDRLAPLLRPHLGASASTALCAALLAVFAALVSTVTFCLVEHPFLVLRTAILRRRATPRLVAT
ncbi:MAG TPA: acyltransferase [Acidobacteriaceae bacterium]|jgi:peptidoglycan/LPS O-acetylase OafA/YrhL|nr:acyltransferase [Acidobacteriaceae bacterium]